MNFDGDLFERLRGRLEEPLNPVCAVCQKPFLRKTGRHKAQITCSPHCSYVYARCRNYFNPESYDTQVRRNARNIVARPEKHRASTVARARAILDGEAVPKRVVRKSSEVFLLLASVDRLDLLPKTESP